MGRKKATTEHLPELIPDGTTTIKEPEKPAEPAETIKKSPTIKQLLADWTSQGKDTRSNETILAALNQLHPGVNWTTGDIANAKQQWKKETGTTKKKETAIALVPDEITFVDMVKVKEAADTYGGVSKVLTQLDELKNVAEAAGGFDRLQDILEKLKVLVE